MATYLDANLLPTQAPYRYPNCTNLRADLPNYGVAIGTPILCSVDYDDLVISPTVTP